ncbi:hypothetical protein [Pseudomonas monteilii]|uniref:hypothetical protein n=1 Tax=Pseudomonas monteilii TaxID=76759 RepID=UPI00076171AD|nr:hypothetical protein [Pseudomonas monteilii]
MKRLIAYIILSLSAAYLSYRYKLLFSYADAKDYANGLLAVSGMIFTIMGIWIAFIYPNAVLRLQAPKKIKTADFTETLDDTKRLQSIVGCVLKSVFVAFMICLIFFAKFALGGLPFVKENIWLFRSLLLGSITFLTFLQGSAVASVMYANFMFVEDLHRRREKREIEEDF